MENEVNILAEEKPKSVKLADGKEYLIPVIHLTTLANIEKTLGFGLNKLQAKMESEAATTLRLAIYALLKETNPTIQLDRAGELVTFDVMKELSETISKIMAIV